MTKPTSKSPYEVRYAKIIDYNRTFSTASGKKVLQDLIDSFHVLRPTFSPGDPHLTSFKEGSREVVLRILSLINTDPRKFLEMAEEVDRNARGE
jgi:hypothetical protein